MEEVNYEIIFAESYLDLAKEAHEKRFYALAQEMALNAFGFFKRNNLHDKMGECREYIYEEHIKNVGEIRVEMDGLLKMMDKVKEVHSRFTLSLSLDQRILIVRNTLVGILEQQGYKNIFQK